MARVLFGNGGAEAEAALPQLLTLWTDKVLGGKERPSAAMLACWAGVLGAASLDTLTGGAGWGGFVCRRVGWDFAMGIHS